MSNTIVVRIALRVGGRQENANGHVHIHGTGSKAQKSYDINIDRDKSLDDQLSTLAHEMVHVAQKAYGRLQIRRWLTDSKFHVRWEGKDVGIMDAIPYYSRPWEVEAFAKQKELFQQWLDKQWGHLLG